MTEVVAEVCIAFQRLVHFSDMVNMSSKQIQDKDGRQVLDRIAVLSRTGQASEQRMPLVARLWIAFLQNVLEGSIDRLCTRSLGGIHRILPRKTPMARPKFHGFLHGSVDFLSKICAIMPHCIFQSVISGLAAHSRACIEYPACPCLQSSIEKVCKSRRLISHSNTWLCSSHSGKLDTPQAPAAAASQQTSAL